MRDTKIREVHPRSVLCPLGVLIHLCSWWSCLCCDLCSSRSFPTPNSRVRDFFVCESFDLVFLALICSMTWVEHFHRRKSLESSQERRSGEFCVRDRFLACVRVIWNFSQSTRLILKFILGKWSPTCVDHLALILWPEIEFGSSCGWIFGRGDFGLVIFVSVQRAADCPGHKLRTVRWSAASSSSCSQQETSTTHKADGSKCVRGASA